MKWHPATVDEVEKIVRDDLAECDEEQLMAFKKYAVEPCFWTRRGVRGGANMS